MKSDEDLRRAPGHCDEAADPQAAPLSNSRCAAPALWAGGDRLSRESKHPERRHFGAGRGAGREPDRAQQSQGVPDDRQESRSSRGLASCCWASKTWCPCARARVSPFTGACGSGLFPPSRRFCCPSCWAKFATLYPEFKLYIREALSQPLLAALQAGELDVLLLALPFPAEQVETMPLFADEFLLACPPSHPLATRSRLTSADLRGEALSVIGGGALPPGPCAGGVRAAGLPNHDSLSGDQSGDDCADGGQ